MITVAVQIAVSANQEDYVRYIIFSGSAPAISACRAEKLLTPYRLAPPTTELQNTGHTGAFAFALIRAVIRSLFQYVEKAHETA
ncbi:hypothetical protein [Ochrobactrum sp. SFR4]|uniref:hypothetical protein n=1 Tax=Ochrobactrum sp. SFR4 TaxID=2717368 RepID=UPI001C8C17A6|nr:hypothetical protein [Ochrobactrum sp. SFR4]MBX8826854.1 hypothetical protein [Ochrobactrum sp. SFR4]